MTSAAPFDPAYFRAQGWWRDETLRDWLNQCVARDAEAPALLAADRTISFAALRDSVRDCAAGLQRIGIRRGDVVAVQLPNIPEFAISWLAIAELGAVMQTVHTPYGTREVGELLSHSGAVACIAMAGTKDRSPAAEIAALRARVATLRHVVSVGDAVPLTENFAALCARGAGPVQFPEQVATEPFLLLYTSGTTSSPKAVSATFNHFLGNARMCAEQLGIQAGDRILTLPPYTHLYGLGTLLFGLSVGATACLLDLFTPAAFARALRRFRPTVLLAGPAHLAPCLQQGLLRDVDLSALRFAVLSGTTVPPLLSAALEDLLPNGKVFQAWGMTELQYGCFGSSSYSREVRFQSVGRATPGTQLRVADAGDRLLGPGEIGELQARGGSLFSGYVGNEEATRSSFTADGWLRTGDLGSIDAEGNVRLHGRTKDLINRGGLKFNPIDMETAVASHPAVSQVAIAPVPDDRLGERAACFVVLRKGASLTFDQLKTFLAEGSFAKVTWPEYLAIVDEMPMTPTRKIMKAALVQAYLKSGALRPEAPGS